MSAVRKVLVIGGGIGGLTAAVALRRQGIAVDLIEVRPDWTVYGVGIIQPNNTLRALDEIGLARACVAAGGPYPGWQIFDEAGRLLMAVPNGTAAAPDFPAVNGIPRPKLHEILVTAAERAGATLRLGVGAEAIEDEGRAVRVRFGDGTEDRYDFVIGCDGLNSQVRRQLFGTVAEPSFTGQGVWRYNLPRPADLEWGHVYFGRASKVGLVPLGPGLMYMFLVTPEPDNPRFAAETLADEMRARLSHYGGLLAELRPLITDPAGVVYRPMEHVMVPAPWHRGRVGIIGDAAHATTPHLAQGAAMAIEDAVLLARLFGQDAPLPDLLDEFMRRRFARAKFVVDSSDQLAAWELAEWRGEPDPAARPGELLHEATAALMEAY